MLDATDQKIIQALQSDARLSLKELAQRAGLSSPSVSERMRRLEERGVLAGYRAEVEPQLIGYPLQAIVRIRPLPGKLAAVQKIIEKMPEVGECDKVTGDDCFVARIYVRSIEQLDVLLDRVAEQASTSTAIVKSQVVRRRAPPLVPRGVR